MKGSLLIRRIIMTVKPNIQNTIVFMTILVTIRDNVILHPKALSSFLYSSWSSCNYDDCSIHHYNHYENYDH